MENPLPGGARRGQSAGEGRVSRARRRRRRPEAIAVMVIVALGVIGIPIVSQAMYPSLTTAWRGVKVVVDAVEVMASDAVPGEYGLTPQLRRLAIDNADALAAGDTSGIPQSMKDQLRARLSRQDLSRLRSWYAKNQPTANDIRSLVSSFD